MGLDPINDVIHISNIEVVSLTMEYFSKGPVDYYSVVLSMTTLSMKYVVVHPACR